MKNGVLLRPVWAEINLDNLKKNYEKVREIIGNRKLIAVVKSNAYGHGSVEIAKELENLGADYLAVRNLEEGIELRSEGVEKPILIMGYVFPKQVNYIVEFSLTPTILSLEFAEELQRFLETYGERIKVHVKIDTGMGRLGVPYKDSIEFIKKLTEFKNIEIEGIYSHFSTADEEDKSFTEEQFKRFMYVVDELEREGIKIPLKHIGNSATVIDLPKFSLDGVRIGIMLYGLKPSIFVREINLHPVMSIRAKIIFLKRVDKGTPISYGRKFYTERESIIATIPMGYSDGYPRALTNIGEVIVKGRRVRVVGRVCMGKFMIDVTDIPDLKVGDEVTIIGRDGEEEITATEIAEKLDTINYEIVSRISRSVPRVYIKEGKPVKIVSFLDG